MTLILADNRVVEGQELDRDTLNALAHYLCNEEGLHDSRLRYQTMSNESFDSELRESGHTYCNFCRALAGRLMFKGEFTVKVRP